MQIELHAHPYFENYSMYDLVEAVVNAGLDIVALERYNQSNYDDIRRYADELKKYGYRVDSDDRAIKLGMGSREIYILRATEVPTSDRFHVLTIGHDSFPYMPMRRIIDQALERSCFVVWDHPFVNARYPMLPITREDDINRICQEYNNKIALEWNGYCLNQYWGMLRLFGLDANRRVVEFSEKLRQNGYNIPVVTDTDLHARSEDALREIGRARIIADIDTTSGERIVESLRDSVFNGNYQNTFRTVSLRHFIFYFAIPLFSEMIFGLNLRSRG